MGELRQDLLTGRWVVVAPSRGERPIAGDSAAAGEDRPALDPGCPFCPGNEEELPSIRWEAPGPGPHGWRCRAVPNRYPAFEAGRTPPGSGVPEALDEAPGPDYASRPLSAPALGRQEVLIESPYHDREPAGMSPEEAVWVLRAYRERLRALALEAPALHPILFRNRGRGAGASLPHPHAQLFGTRVEGPRRRILRERLEAYHRAEGRCLLCAGPGAAPAARDRIVDRDEHHVAYVPWAPERPLEMRIVPRRHAPAFGKTEGPALESLARIFVGVLGRLRAVASGPDYNYVLHTWGEDAGGGGLHWHLQIRPRTSRLAGFEIGTGVTINASSPERDAEDLRRADTRGKGDRDG